MLTNLTSRTDQDWRDVEALAAIGTPPAVEAIRKMLSADTLETRIAAAEALNELGELPDLGPFLAEALRNAKDLTSFSRALDIAEDFPTDDVKKSLLWCALHGDGTQRVHSVAMLYYFAGLSSEAFDWDHRPFFLRFGEDEPEDEIRKAFKELCSRIGADPNSV